MRGVLSTPHAPCITPRLTSIAGSGSKMAPVGPSEEELGRAWDRCLVDTAFKSGNPSDVLMRELILYSFKFVFSFLLSSGWTDCWNSLFIRLVQEWVPVRDHYRPRLLWHGLEIEVRNWNFFHSKGSACTYFLQGASSQVGSLTWILLLGRNY